MPIAHLDHRRNFFEDEGCTEAFSESFLKLLASIQKSVVAKYLPPENTQRLRHGGECSHPGLPEAYQSGIQQHTSTATVSFAELINHDLSAIGRCVADVREDMERQFAQMMYASISSACEQSGNVVNAEEAGSLPEAFSRMLETVEFAANKDGSVSLPEIHMGPQTLERFTKAIADASPDYHDRIERIKKRKITEALAKETDRKARFARYGDSE